MTHGRAIFVTGTDTGVGKTVVAAGLARLAVDAGLSVGVFKPIETGVTEELGPLDGCLLKEAARSIQSLDDIVPVQYEEPLAPYVAAQRSGVQVDLDAIDVAWARSRTMHDIVVVEGCGGLLVPITDELTVAHLIQRLDIPVLLVTRAGLGTLNHTALTVAVARQMGLDLRGFILNGFESEQVEDIAMQSNPAELVRLTGLAELARLPRRVDGDYSNPALIAEDLHDGDQCIRYLFSMLERFQFSCSEYPQCL